LSVDPLTTPKHPDPTSGAHQVRIGDHATTLHLEAAANQASGLDANQHLVVGTISDNPAQVV